MIEEIVIIVFFLSLCISHFLGEKLQYLQPLMETLLMFMEHISCIYYQCSLSIVKLLPPDVLNEELFTKFECSSFWISGEINYQVLKVSISSVILHFSKHAYLRSF